MIAVMDLPYVRPELAWDLVLRVVRQTEDERVLGALAASILEDLLTYHGEDYIERIATEANRSARFKTLLAGVWLAPEDNPVWEQLYDVAEIEPPFPEGWRDSVDDA